MPGRYLLLLCAQLNAADVTRLAAAGQLHVLLPHMHAFLTSAAAAATLAATLSMLSFTIAFAFFHHTVYSSTSHPDLCPCAPQHHVSEGGSKHISTHMHTNHTCNLNTCDTYHVLTHITGLDPSWPGVVLHPQHLERSYQAGTLPPLSAVYRSATCCVQRHPPLPCRVSLTSACTTLRCCTQNTNCPMIPCSSPKIMYWPLAGGEGFLLPPSRACVPGNTRDAVSEAGAARLGLWLRT